MIRRWKLFTAVTMLGIVLAIPWAHWTTRQRWGPILAVGNFAGPDQPLWSKLVRGKAPTDTGLFHANQRFGDADLRQLHAVDGLIWLNLSDSSITDAAPAELASFRTLTNLSMSRRPITDAGVGQLAKMPRLEYLDLSGTLLTDEGATHFEDMKSLKGLWLKYTQITDDGLLRLAGCAGLKFVFLDGVRVTDQAVAELQKTLPELRIHR